MLDVAFSHDGNRIAAAYADGRVRLWGRGRSASDEQVLDDVIRRGGRRPVSCLVFSPDGRTLAAGSGDGAVWLWNLSAVHENATILRDGPQRAVHAIAFDSGGQWFAAGFGDGSVLVWPTLDAIVERAYDRLYPKLTQADLGQERLK